MADTLKGVASRRRILQAMLAAAPFTLMSRLIAAPAQSTGTGQPPVTQIIVFDVNETLLDVRAIEPHFKRIFGDAGALKEWFSLMLLHSEVASLAGPYFDFASLAGAALEMTASARNIPLAQADKDQVLQGMLSLPPHGEVSAALEKLKEAGFRMVTLTNSSQRAVDQQLKNAGLTQFFERRFTVDAIKRFKPAREPYQMVATELGVQTRDLRLVAAHAWDIIGAMQAGCAAAFVARPGKVLFPLTSKPDIIGADLAAVANQIISKRA